jgi:hypothetical protein
MLGFLVRVRFPGIGDGWIGETVKRRRWEKELRRERERERFNQRKCKIPRKLEKAVTGEEAFDTWNDLIGLCWLGACRRGDAFSIFEKKVASCCD